MDSLLKSKYKVESLIIISLPFLIIISRFMLEVCLLIISISFLFKVIRNKEYKIFNNYFVFFFLCFYSLLLLSFLFSNEKSNILSILLYFRFGLYVMATYYFLIKESYIINFFLNSITILILLLFFDGIFQYFFGYNMVGLKNSEVHRITSFFGDEQILGAYTVRMFPFLLLLKEVTNRNSKIFNYLTSGAILITPIIIFISGERVAMILFALMLSYYLVFFIKSKKFKFIYFYVVFVIFSSGTFLYTSDVYYDRYVTQTMNSLFDKEAAGNKFFLPKEYQDNNNFYFLSAQHQNFVYTAINVFKKNKFLGTGPKSYRYICSNKDYGLNYLSCNTHPHNYYIQLIIEMGLSGFIFLASIYLYIIYRSFINLIKLFKKKYCDLSEVIILGFYFTQLWPLMQHGNLFNNWNSIVLFLPMAFLLYLKKIHKNKANINT